MMRRRVPPPAEQQDEDRPKGFDDFELRLGDVLRGERATMGKSLLDVQRELKIKANYIAAIENADPTAFESQGFIPVMFGPMPATCGWTRNGPINRSARKPGSN